MWQNTTDVVHALNQILRRVPVWLVYFLGVIPAPWWFYLGLTGGLGVEPIEALEHRYGELALQLLVLGLAISPLRRIVGLNLIKFRRAVGVLTFTYVSLHLLVWLVLDVQVPSQIWADILKRPYITVGMAAFVLMLPLAVTSNNWSVRKLGPRWRKLHRLVYPVAILGAVHYVMLAKGFQIEPLIYLAAILVLLTLRLPIPFGMNRRRQADSL
ncbi:sulfite oxidase [Ruegeria sp. ANG-S4]|nr:sulfite oxidase [Ruegeria sp. ANG-S4]